MKVKFLQATNAIGMAEYIAVDLESLNFGYSFLKSSRSCCLFEFSVISANKPKKNLITLAIHDLQLVRYIF